jgi:membrane protease YdiL (CAAX protease family)
MNFDPAPSDPTGLDQTSPSAGQNAEKIADGADALVANFGNANPAASPESSAAAAPSIVCRRCGKNVVGSLSFCPYCEARLSIGANESPRDHGIAPRFFASHSASESAVAITQLLMFYVLLLFTNLVGHWISQALSSEHLSVDRRIDSGVTLAVVVEAADTIVVLIALAKIPRPPRIGPTRALYRNIGAAAAPFVLVIALGLNFGYHELLRNYVQYPFWVRNDLHFPIAWAIVLICIQPAIIEELFCRYLALGTLARVMGTAAAVGVSSLMFGMAHSGVLLSIPILTVVGVGLGLVRVWSGSILLPILLHALHNAAVLYMEWVK